MKESVPTIAIIGGGASGTLLAANLLKLAASPLRVVLVEQTPPFGAGAAYRSPHSSLLLNIPASNMSAFPNQPLHFVDWLRNNIPDGKVIIADSFVPRQWYKLYLNDILNEAATSAQPDVQLVYQSDEATGIVYQDKKVAIQFCSESTIFADQVVLAVGNFAPRHPPQLSPSLQQSERYRHNPWGSQALADIPQAATVLILGTGLTMVDIVVTLRKQSHTGQLFAVSRHGLVPAAHLLPLLPPQPVTLDELQPITTRNLVRTIRRITKEAEVAGINWRQVIDGLRPYVSQIWQQLSLDDRATFLRHVQAYWEVRRHRLAPQIAQEFEQLLASDQLHIAAGSYIEFTELADSIDFTYRDRHSGYLEHINADYILNCTGPNTHLLQIDQPLIQSLVAQEFIQPHNLHLGMDITAEGAAIDVHGQPVSWLWTIGALRKGRLWETTAIPEIRQQAYALAHALLSRF